MVPAYRKLRDVAKTVPVPIDCDVTSDGRFCGDERLTCWGVLPAWASYLLGLFSLW